MKEQVLLVGSSSKNQKNKVHIFDAFGKLYKTIDVSVFLLFCNYLTD